MSNGSSQKPELKRILILNWRDLRHQQSGGAEVYAHELAQRWVKAGHEVRMFCGNDGRSPRHETIDGVEITRRGSFHLVYVWAFVYYLFRLRQRTDVIVDCHNGIPFFTPLYSRKPIYCVLHHVHQEVFKQYMHLIPAAVAGFLERVIMPLAYRHCRFVTVSESSKQAMVHELGIKADRIEIVYNGIDANHYVPGRKSAQPTVLYLGRLKAYKSIDVLIKAFAQIIAKQPAARLVVAGAGDAEAELKRLSKELKVNSKVEFFGWVSDADKVRLMQSAWAFSSPSFAEGWGITIIEANACGTPVVATDVSGLRESVRPGSSGFLVPYGDVEAIADKLQYLLSDKITRDKLSRSARSWAIRFDWQQSADKFLRIIT